MYYELNDEQRETIEAALKATRMKALDLTHWDYAHRAKSDDALNAISQPAPVAVPDAVIEAVSDWINHYAYEADSWLSLSGESAQKVGLMRKAQVDAVNSWLAAQKGDE